MDMFANKVDPDEDENGYDHLCKYSIEKCELCDMVFSSRFANIIHSSQHTIIPLIKLNIHQCKKCLHSFTSKSELKAHKRAKHKNKHADEDNDGEIDQEESQIGQKGAQIGLERSQIGLEGSQIGQEGAQIGLERSQIGLEGSQIGLAGGQIGQVQSQIDQKGSQIIIDHKKRGTGKKKSPNSKKKSQIDHNETQNDKDALLQSIITKQPIVKVDDIGSIFAKTLLPTKTVEKDSPKMQKDKQIVNNKEKDNAKTKKDAKKIVNNKEKDNTKTKKDTKNNNEMDFFNTKNVNKELNPPETILSSMQTSQNDIPEIVPSKIIIGGKKPTKRTSPDKTESSKSKINKKSTNTDGNMSERDEKTETAVTNGVHTTDLTIDPTNRYSFNYRAVSPDVISIKSDSSDDPKDEFPILNPPVASTRSIFQFSFDDDDTAKEVEPQKDQSKNVPQKNLSINTPFLITDSDNDLDPNIDEILNKVTSPVKTSNFRSKLQFEDDESIRLLDLEKELTQLTYEFKSVHYDELMETEMSECQRCHMIFMNRLTLFKHEATHLRIRRARKHYFCKYCESYYLGNHYTQKKHYETVHNTTVDKKKVYSCPICKLQYYKLKLHYKKHHPHLICKDCSTCFGTIKVFNEHNCSKTISQVKILVDSKETQKNYDLLLVCELCLSFTKTTGNFKYEVVGEKCEVGTRQKCFYCAKEFFEVKIVKRVNFMTSIKSQNLKNSDGKASDGKKKNSNAAKLQSIQKRLKAMKK